MSAKCTKAIKSFLNTCYTDVTNYNDNGSVCTLLKIALFQFQQPSDRPCNLGTDTVLLIYVSNSKSIYIN